jgi:hypothetical protein
METSDLPLVFPEKVVQWLPLFLHRLGTVFFFYAICELQGYSGGLRQGQLNPDLAFFCKSCRWHSSDKPGP